MPSGSWRDTPHVEHFGSKTKRDVLLPRWVESGDPVCVVLGLGGEALVVKYMGLEWNEERTTRADVKPGPAMQKYIGRESIGVGTHGSWISVKERGPVNDGE